MPTEDTSSQHFPEDEADEEDDTHTPTHLHPAEFIPQTHDRSSSPLPTEVQVSPSGHVDWNWPPAFKGRAVSASPGKSPSKSPGARMVAVEEVVEISDDDDEKDQDEDELDVPQHESVADAEDEDDSPEVAGAPSDDFNDVFTIANSNSTSTSNPESFEIDTFLQTHPDALEPDVEAMYPPDGNEAEILDIANHEPYEGGVGASEEGEGFEPLRTPSVGFGDLPDDGDDQAQAQAVGGRPEEGVGEGVEGMGIDVPDFLEKLVQLASSGAFSAPPNASLTAVSDSNSLAGPSNIPQDQELSAEALEALEQQFVGEQTPDPSYELGYEYTVSEPSEPGDRARSQRGMSLDVTSVTGEVGYVDVEVEVGVEVEVEVEEVGTEGRRSEEPGLVVEVLDEEFESVVVEEEEKTKLDEGLSDSKEKELNGIQAADIEAGESLSVRTKPDVEVETPVVVEDQQPVNTDDFVEAREAQISKAQPAPIVQSDEGVEESSQVFEPAKPDDTTETGKAETSSQAAPIVQIRMDDVVEGSSQLVEPVKVDDAMETVEAEAETPSEEKSVSIVQVNEGIEEVPQSVEPVVVDDTIAAEPTTSPQSPLVERISSPEVMLQPGIPMPVSADPDVPDPASIHVSPIDSPKPATPEEDEESDRDEANVNPNSNTTVASAIPPNLLRHISGHRTVSGLFTPMSEGSSYPPSPTMQDVIDEQPTEETPLETPVESSSPVPEGASSADVAPSPQAEQPEPASSKSEDDVSAALEHVQDQPEVPASTSPPQVDESQGSAPLTPQGDDADDADLDEDADGDVDPDYEAPEEVVTVDVSSPTPEASGERTPRGVSVAPEVQVNGDVPSGGDDENEPRHQSDLPLVRKMLSRNLRPWNQMHQ
ncbi:hypothetical protein BC629DRAFT_453879 [Irpex lacteus]|nr:hypothetical protein BC629DRAFT_453879 [Irpex lacteus]